MCSGCVNHSKECIYNFPPSSACRDRRSVKAKYEEFSADSTKPQELSPPYADTSVHDLDADARRSLELLLLHHFCSKVHKTLGGFINATAKDSQRWITNLVDHAMVHDFLLHSIFAVAALHLVLEPDSLSPQCRSKHEFAFAKMHRVYMNMAIREQNHAISNIDSSNAEALTWASFMSHWNALSLLPEDRAHQDHAFPMQWLTMHSAVASMFRATQPFLKGTVVEEYSTTGSGPDFRDHKIMYNYEYAEPFRSILLFDDGIETVDDNALVAYDRVLAYVARTCEALKMEQTPSATTCRRLTGIGAMAPKEFIILMQQERPRAMVILAHQFAMMQSMDHICWFRGFAQRNVADIKSRLSSQWLWAMDWPVKTFERIRDREHLSG